MNIVKLSLKNLIHRPLSLVLSVVLFALGLGLISLMFKLNKQVQDQFDNNLAGIDLVIGAKGSSLQLVLCNMYHIDNPTGNISVEEATPFLNPANPMISKSVPLSLGDNYRGYRIVGTTGDFPKLYKAEVEKGKMWEFDFEVSIGAVVARALNLELGHEFHGAHGLAGDDVHVHDYMPPYVVKGILKPTGTVIDQLILTNTASVWMVHHDHDGEHDASHDHGETEVHDHSHDHNHSHHHEKEDNDPNDQHAHSTDESPKEGEIQSDHHEHGPNCGHHHEFGHSAEDQKGSNEVDFILKHHDEDITAVLVKFSGRGIQSLNMGRQINENTNLQAAAPAYEINRLFDMMGTGLEALELLGWIIAIVSGFSIFIALFQSLSRRKYELAIIRVMGSSRVGLFGLILLEGFWISLLGYLASVVFSKLAMLGISEMVKSDFRYDLQPFEFMNEDLWLLGAAIVIGVLAAVIPAIMASRTDIAKTLLSK